MSSRNNNPDGHNDRNITQSRVPGVSQAQKQRQIDNGIHGVQGRERVIMWDRDTQRRMHVGVPLRQNVAHYMQKYPSREVYVGQDLPGAQQYASSSTAANPRAYANAPTASQSEMGRYRLLPLQHIDRCDLRPLDQRARLQPGMRPDAHTRIPVRRYIGACEVLVGEPAPQFRSLHDFLRANPAWEVFRLTSIIPPTPVAHARLPTLPTPPALPTFAAARAGRSLSRVSQSHLRLAALAPTASFVSRRSRQISAGLDRLCQSEPVIMWDLQTQSVSFSELPLRADVQQYMQQNPRYVVYVGQDLVPRRSHMAEPRLPSGGVRGARGDMSVSPNVFNDARQVPSFTQNATRNALENATFHVPQNLPQSATQNLNLTQTATQNLTKSVAQTVYHPTTQPVATDSMSQAHLDVLADHSTSSGCTMHRQLQELVGRPTDLLAELQGLPHSVESDHVQEQGNAPSSSGHQYGSDPDQAAQQHDVDMSPYLDSDVEMQGEREDETPIATLMDSPKPFQ